MDTSALIMTCIGIAAGVLSRRFIHIPPCDRSAAWSAVIGLPPSRCHTLGEYSFSKAFLRAAISVRTYLRVSEGYDERIGQVSEEAVSWDILR